MSFEDFGAPAVMDMPAAMEQPVLADSLVEASVLSILLHFSQAWDEYSGRLTAAHFAIDGHKKIFLELVRQKAAQPTDIDALTVMVALQGVLDGGWVHEVLACNAFSARGVARLVGVLDELHKSRQLKALSYTLSELAFADGPAAERVGKAQAALSALDVQGGEDEWVDAYTAAMEHLELVDKRDRGEVLAMSSGLFDFDEALDGGFIRGNLVVIGARPAMGKSALAMTIGLHMAHEWHVGMLSMEMPHADLRDRQMAILGRLAISSIKRPKAGDGLDYTRMVDAVERSKPLKWMVSDKSGLNILQVCSMARRLKRTKGLDVLIVDYIGLMEGLDKKQSRAYQIEEISRGLKGLAKELDIVVLCLAQVNRGAAERSLEPPGLHELRDSGAIEQDADVVAFIHRPIAAKPELGGAWASYAKLRIAKNRQGRIGDIHLHYRGESTTFEAWGGPLPGKQDGAVQSSQPRRGMD